MRTRQLFAAAILACGGIGSIVGYATVLGQAARPEGPRSVQDSASAHDVVLEWNQIFNDTVLASVSRVQLPGDQAFGSAQTLPFQVVV